MTRSKTVLLCHPVHIQQQLLAERRNALIQQTRLIWAVEELVAAAAVAMTAAIAAAGLGSSSSRKLCGMG